MPHDTPGAVASARALEEKLNGNLIYTPDQMAQIAPQYKVYIFNVGPLAHRSEKGSAGVFVIPECPPGAEYGEPLVLPSVCSDTYLIENEMKTHSVTGEYMAQDIVHPQIGQNWSFGQNLDDFGVFWTKNETPTAAELKQAHARLEATFRKVLGMATTLETSGKLNDITPLMRIAASYFGEDRPWNKIYKRLETCPGCGEAAKPGIIRHGCGYVFDPDRAMLAGMIDAETHARMTLPAGQAGANAEKPEKATRPAKRR